ncbi:MAG: hypothetical protein IJE89_01980 [Bacilli bacterium]|nr:hypothetical protein [Bacilli bacterium]
MEQFKRIIKKNVPMIIILLTTIILVFPLLGNKVSSGHDYDFHVTNFLLNQSNINILKLDFIIPKVFGGNIANSFGYGTGIFYPPLSYYLTSYLAYFFQIIKVNSILALPFLQIIIFFLSSLMMYKFVKRVSNDNTVAIISAISYISSVYFITNIYVRIAIAESLTFIFIPLVFWGLYELFFGAKKKFYILFTLGYVGLINCHLVLSIYITMFIIIVFLIFFKKVFKKEIIKKLIFASILILLISSPFLVPLLEHKFYGNYVVFNQETMYTIKTIKENALSLKDFFIIKIKTPNGVEVYMNYVIIYMTLITIHFNKQIFKKEKKYIFWSVLVILIVSTFISTKYFPWAIMPSFIKMIQFPWRMCGIIGFCSSILSGYFTKIIDSPHKKTIVCIIGLFIVLFGASTIPRERVTKPYYPTEISMGVQKEYLPQKTIENIEYFEKRNKEIIIKNGKANIDILEKETPYLKANIKLESETPVVIELPRLYYLGYSIKLQTDKELKKVKYKENEKGFIELEVEESGILEVQYEGTIANKISNYISIITIFSCIFALIYKKNKKNR